MTILEMLRKMETDKDIDGLYAKGKLEQGPACVYCGRYDDEEHTETCLLAQAIADAEDDVRKFPFQIHCRGKTRAEWLERLEGLLPEEFGPVKAEDDVWVPVEDGLPECRTRVLTFRLHKESLELDDGWNCPIAIAWVCEDDKWYTHRNHSGNYGPTHWKPITLPKIKE